MNDATFDMKIEDDYLDCISSLEKLIKDIDWSKTSRKERNELNDQFVSIAKQLYSIYGFQMHEDFDLIPDTMYGVNELGQ